MDGMKGYCNPREGNSNESHNVVWVPNANQRFHR